MHSYASLQGQALYKGMSLFFVPIIVCGIDFRHLKYSTSLKHMNSQQIFNPNNLEVTGGANMWSWMDVVNVYCMLTDQNFAFAGNYQYWCFVMDQGCERYTQPGFVNF